MSVPSHSIDRTFRVSPGLRRFIEIQLRLLESLLGREWFSAIDRRKQQHPAFKQWERFLRLFHLNCVSHSQLLAVFPQLHTLILHNSSIAKCSGAKPFAIGNFANYGDRLVQKRITSAIHDEHAFLSVMTEFAYASSHLLAGRQIRAFENEGFADLMVTGDGLELPLFAETKRIAHGTTRKRYGKVISKINQQLKTSMRSLSTSGYGLGIIDVTSHVPDCTFSDATPAEVIELSSTIQNSLAFSNSSVSGILIFWDSWKLYDSSPRGCLAVMVRRNHLIRHKAPLRALPSNERLFRSEYTLELTFSAMHPPTLSP